MKAQSDIFIMRYHKTQLPNCFTLCLEPRSVAVFPTKPTVALTSQFKTQTRNEMYSVSANDCLTDVIDVVRRTCKGGTNILRVIYLLFCFPPSSGHCLSLQIMK